jgi:hypothetical protein
MYERDKTEEEKGLGMKIWKKSFIDDVALLGLDAV